jgi:hypothetical protein
MVDVDSVRSRKGKRLMLGQDAILLLCVGCCCLEALFHSSGMPFLLAAAGLALIGGIRGLFIWRKSGVKDRAITLVFLAGVLYAGSVAVPGW